jgi:hypothetical protein
MTIGTSDSNGFNHGRFPRQIVDYAFFKAHAAWDKPLAGVKAEPYRNARVITTEKKVYIFSYNQVA